MLDACLVYNCALRGKNATTAHNNIDFIARTTEQLHDSSRPVTTFSRENMAPIGLGIWFGDEIPGSELDVNGTGPTVPRDWIVQHHEITNNYRAPTRRQTEHLVFGRRPLLMRDPAQFNRKGSVFM